MTISGERTEQLDIIFCRVNGFASDFLCLIVVELIRFFHGALQLYNLQDGPANQLQCDFNVSIRVLQEFVKNPSVRASLLLRTFTSCFYSWGNPACIVLLGIATSIL